MTKQHCWRCSSQTLKRIPGLTGLGNWWCCSCSQTSSPVVEKCEYNSLPFSTAGIPRVQGGATLLGPVEREDLDWHLARLSKRRAPRPDAVPNELIATAPDELKQTLLDCLNAVLDNGQPLPVDWLEGPVRFLNKPGGGALEPEGGAGGSGA